MTQSSTGPSTHPLAGKAHPDREHVPLRVSAKTDPTDLAGAITNFMIQHGIAELSAVGGEATYVALKGTIIARSMGITQGFDLVAVPSFFESDHPTQPGDKLVGIRIVLRPVKDQER